MNILPLTYLGNIEYFTRLCYEPSIIDINENYIKQTYRNRCEVMCANGVISLTINLVKPQTAKCLVKDMRIDYSKRWQHQHWKSLVSSYTNSPYFEHYADLFAPFYEKKYDFLVDYNLELTRLVKSALGFSDSLNISEQYITPTDEDCDLRGVISPKYRPSLEEEKFKCQPYYQVFSEKMNFAPNLSIVDLLFCENELPRG